MKIRLDVLTNSLKKEGDCSFEVTVNEYGRLPVFPHTNFSGMMPFITSFNELYPGHEEDLTSKHQAIAMLRENRKGTSLRRAFANYNGLYFVKVENAGWIVFEYEDQSTPTEYVHPWHGPIYRANDAVMEIVRRCAKIKGGEAKNVCM